AVEGGPITVETVYKGDVLGRLELENGLIRGRYPVPGQVPGVAEVGLRFDPPIEQPAAGPQEIALRSIGLLPVGAEPLLGDRVAHFDEADRAVRLRHPGSLVMPLHLPRGAARIRCEIGVPAAAPADDLLLEAFALDATGRRIVLEATVDTKGWWTLPVAALAGRRVFLVLEVPRSELTIRRPVLELEGRSELDGAGTEPQAAAFGAQRPDVLLVVFDAARGDRFLPGKRQQVAPNVDRLAAEGIAFSQASAECPTTSCSIPSLITGVSFQPVGDVWRGPPLGDEATTLAEYLRRAGYRTVGYSATPNNSQRLNSAQGFDVFEELWGAGHPHHGPFGMSELAVAAIRQQPEGQPLYLQLHYLPPHEPYDPLPRFDRFTDPDFRGSIGPQSDLRPYKSGAQQLRPADLQQLVGLYDGNLLMADDAFGRVIEALQEAGRWRRTLVVVTSDHGEAFMEHGVWGHNTTLYEEMLHVPLILRLPGGEAVPGVDRERPAGLLDVVPTVLARLGLEPETEVDGIDLLGPSGENPRALFHRTSSLRWPELALRSGDWKLVVWPRLQRQQLFDLAGDPGETENLAAARPLLFAGLGLLVRQQVERTLLRRGAGDETEPTREEVETLRALGYLN
ncbi:MAG: sulfatase, partial [Thermoanaerobaculia bacterium]